MCIQLAKDNIFFNFSWPLLVRRYDDVYAVNATAERVYQETEQRYGPLVGSSHPAKLIQEKGGSVE